MKKVILLIVSISFSFLSFGDETEASVFTSTIRGKVIDKNLQSPLIGVNIILLSSDPIIGTITGINGEFKLENIPAGRQGIQLRYIGYNPVTLNNLILNSAKELVLEIEMEEKIITTEEVLVKAYSRKDRPINEMAQISARSFTIEETERYAGSWGDPSRMATNFAGVMSGGDQINDIIIRGNSPAGLLWRLEGVNIPNPNHFGALGTTGGPISMLNSNVLTNSDFYTGAFPAEFGNATSGAFDLRMRSGNNQKREHLFQVGFNGFELGTEGPLSERNKSSYIANYRYSTMGVFDALGLDMGIGAVPKYQDLHYKFDFPGTKAGRFTLFGLGGLSNISFAIKDSTEVESGGTHFTSDMGVVGFNHLIYLNETTRIKSSVALSGTRTTTIDSVYEYEILNSKYGDKSTETKISFSTELRKKFNSRNNFIIGGTVDYIKVSYLDSFYIKDYDLYFNNLNIDGDLGLIQAHASWKHKFSDELTLISGLHYQQNTLNNDIAIEPRTSIKWNLASFKSLSFGYGMHSMIQPRIIYFYKTLVDTANSIYQSTNKDLTFTKSHQLVLGYDHSISANFRVKAEAYYQYLYDVPVEEYPSHRSMINYGSSYMINVYDSLMNKGTGYNYGLELTLEKFLSNNYYFLVTASVFDAKYKGSDEVLRNSVFNGNYILNALGGYEFQFENQNALAIDLKGVYAGGMRWTPIIPELSDEDPYFDYSKAYDIKYNDYYKFDLRISYRLNREKTTQEWALDITNLTNHHNRFIEIYNEDTKEMEQATQMGIMPMVFYRIQF